MTKGQRAMAVAKVLDGREYKNYTLGVSKQYVSWARIALEFAPDIADNVLTGSASRAIETSRRREVSRRRDRPARGCALSRAGVKWGGGTSTT